MQSRKVLKLLGLTLLSMLCIIGIASFIGDTNEDNKKFTKIANEEVSKEKETRPEAEKNTSLSSEDSQVSSEQTTDSSSLDGNKENLEDPEDLVEKGKEDELAVSDNRVGETVDKNSEEETKEEVVDKNSEETKEELENEVIEAFNIKNPDIDVDANHAILMNCNTKDVLYYKDATTKIAPASTAKLLTAIVAIENCDLEEQITVGNEIHMMASDSSRAYLDEGEILTLEMLLEGLLLPSGNDAAYVIAVHVGRLIAEDNSLNKKAAVSTFIEAMNKKAKEIGANNSNFLTPDGYDADGQYTTAYDLALIGMESLKYDVIREISSKSRTRNIFVSGEDVTWKSSNKLITSGSGYYYPYAIGLKTGTSEKAGKCLVSAANKDGVDYVCVIMDSEGRWQDSINVLKYGVERK